MLVLVVVAANYATAASRAKLMTSVMLMSLSQRWHMLQLPSILWARWYVRPAVCVCVRVRLPAGAVHVTCCELVKSQKKDWPDLATALTKLLEDHVIKHAHRTAAGEWRQLLSSKPIKVRLLHREAPQENLGNPRVGTQAVLLKHRKALEYLYRSYTGPHGARMQQRTFLQMAKVIAMVLTLPTAWLTHRLLDWLQHTLMIDSRCTEVDVLRLLARIQSDERLQHMLLSRPQGISDADRDSFVEEVSVRGRCTS